MAGESRIDILIAARDQAKATIEGVKTELGGVSNAAGIAASGLGAMAAAAGLAGAVSLVGTITELARTGAEAERAEKAFGHIAQTAGIAGDEMLAAMKKASAGTVSNADLISAANRALVLGVATSTEDMTRLLDIARVRGAAFGRTTAQGIDDLVVGIGRKSPMILDNLGFKGGQKDIDAFAASIGKTTAELTDAQVKGVLLNKVITETKGELAAAGAAGTDAASQFEKLSATMDNAKERLGKLFAPTIVGDIETFVGAIDFLQNKLDELGKDNRAVQVLSLLAQAADRTLNPIGAATSGVIALARATGVIPPAADAAAAATAGFVGSIARSEAATDAAGDAQARLKIKIDATGDAGQKFAAQIRAATGATDDMRGSVLTLAGALPGLQAQLNTFLAGAAQARASAVSALAGKAAGTNTDDATRQKLYAEGVKTIDLQTQALNASLREGVITQDDYTLKIAQLGTGAGDAFDAITKAQQEADAAAKKFANTMESDVKKAARDAQAEFDKLQGKVSGVLSAALGDVAGVNVADLLVNPKETDPKKQVSLLPRDDTISEDARRLADIAVNGFKSPWYAYFKTEFPALFGQFVGANSGDELGVRQQAAKLVRSFQEGLEPELLDKEKAKERVRKMLIGEANLASLAKEIATELAAEMGNAAPADLANSVNVALGVRGAGAGLGAGSSADVAAGAGVSGTTAGSAFATAAAEAAAGTGTKMVSALDSQLRADANVNLIRTAGEAAGTNWGNAFMTTVGNNVPKALIDLITSLVTPQVVTYFNTQTQLAGAQP